LKRLLDTRDYYRFQTQVDEDSSILDNTSPANIKRLKALALQSINDQSTRFEDACLRLLENKQL
jgi:hypothetical protein